MNWDPALDTPIVLLGVLCAVACTLPGTFLVARRMSMTSEAIAHAALPGVIVAFLWTGSKSIGPMLLGAVAVGILTTLLIHAVRTWGRLDAGTSMGVVFTTLFAIGLLLVRRQADGVCLEPHVVLFGNMNLAPFGDTVWLLGREWPRPTAMLGILAVVNALLLALFYRPLRLSSFDPEHARSLRIPVGWLSQGLLVVTAVTTVAAFEAVGVILVVAMTVVPAAAARLCTQTLRAALLVGLLIAIAGVFAGHLVAITLPAHIAPWLAGEAGRSVVDTHSSGTIAVTYGALFLVALICGPRGPVAQWFRRRAWRRAPAPVPAAR